jgi:hypothetical protein
MHGFQRAAALSAPDPRSISPRRDAEGGGRVGCTRKVLLAEDRKWARPTRPPGDLSPSVPLSGRSALASPRGARRGPGAPLRCVTRTAGRNAGGFPGRHPGTAAGPLSGLPRTQDSAGAGADHLPRRPAPVPARRPPAGRTMGNVRAVRETGIRICSQKKPSCPRRGAGRRR